MCRAPAKAIDSAARYAANREHYRVKHAAYRALHLDEERARRIAYRAAHPMTVDQRERATYVHWMYEYRKRKARAAELIESIRAQYPDLVAEVFPNG